MKFKTVTMKNYFTYGDNEISFKFDDAGTSIITGPNGVGKSTIFSAIIWALYGRSSVSIEDVINRYTKKNCKVGVQFEVLNQVYTVYRYRRHDTHGNNLYIFKGDENISLKKVTDTEQLIQDIIQIPYQAMVSSILFSFENYTSFLRAKAADRLKIIESVLFLKEVTEYYNITRDFVKKIDKELEDVTHEFDKIEYARDTLTKSLNEYKVKVKSSLEEFKKEKELKEKEIQRLKDEAKELATIDIQKELNLIRTHREIVNHNTNINNQINSLRKNITPDLEKKLAEVRNKIFALSSINVDEELLLIKNNREAEEKNRLVEKEIVSLESKIDSFDYLTEIKKVGDELLDLTKELEEVHKNTCYACHRPFGVDESNKEVLVDREKKVESVGQRLKDLVSNKDRVDASNKNLEKQISTLKAKLISFIPSKYTEDKLRSIKDSVLQLESEANVLESKLEGESKILENIKELMLSIKEVPENSKYTETQLTDVNSIQQTIESYEREIELINVKARSALDKHFIEDNSEKIKKLEKAKDKTNKKKEEILSEKKYYSVLMDVFSNKEAGFKKFFIDKIISVFNSNINKYLPIFFDKEINITFDKELNEKIIYDGFDAPFEGFSSGQKTRIDLAIAFSLFFLAKTFFSTTINLICLDEVIDMNLDSAGFDGVINIIQNLSEEHAVYIISHRDEYKDKFNKHIKVYSDDNGFSSIKIA